MRPITKLASLHLRTPALEESVDYYTRSFGLDLRTRDDQRATFSGARQPTKVLEISKGDAAGIAGLSFAMRSSDDLQSSARSLAAKGFTVSAGDPADVTNSSFSVSDPDGHRIEFVLDEGPSDELATPDGRPLYVSHVVLNSRQPLAMTSFFVDVLGFKIADRYERDLLTFLRCAQPQHHCLGISPGEAESLNHFSLDVGSIDALMKSVGRMQKNGFKPVWGPGRHGPGGNVFCYFEDPTGFVSEFTCDVLQIEDEDAWVPQEWPRVPETANVWGTGGPSPRAIELMSGQVKADPRS